MMNRCWWAERCSRSTFSTVPTFVLAGVVKDFLASGAACRLHLEQMPGYAPKLNSDEGIWRYLKRVELRNVCYHTLTELRYELRLAIARLRHKLSVIMGCITYAGYRL
jgi:hypothetical protein